MRVAILAGGRGKRIGMEKTEVFLLGKKLIEIAVEKCRSFDYAIVCRDEEQAEKLEVYGRVLVDEYKNFGVLAGLYAAIKRLGSCVVFAVDMPFVKPEVLMEIWKKAEELKCDALVPIKKFPEPLLAFYSSTLVKVLERAILCGEKRILNALRGKVVFYPSEYLKKIDPDLLSFFNINTLEDLKLAEEICRKL
ncbi:MAG: molybdenum cofactor guanylyltransferase [Archaeoglobaceae archaeon]